MPNEPSSSREPRFTDAAISDLDEIEDYISRDSPAAAIRVVRRIRDVCFTPAEQPMMGRSRSELAPNVRSFPVGNYVIYYRPINDTVEIMRIYHARRDIASLHLQ